MSEGNSHYILTTGTYRIGAFPSEKHLVVRHRARIKTDEPVWQRIDPSCYEGCEVHRQVPSEEKKEFEVFPIPPSTSVLLNRRDDAYFLDYYLFKEFKEKLLREVFSEVRCDPKEFSPYRIGKPMTASNVTELITSVFREKLGPIFRKIFRKSICYVVSARSRTTIVDGDRPLSYSEEVEVKKGDRFNGSERVVLYFPDYPNALFRPRYDHYTSERSKILVYLDCFANMEAIKEGGTMSRLNRPRFDYIYVFEVLNEYYGRDEYADWHLYTHY